MKVLLDANFLMLVVQRRVDVFGDIEKLFDETVEFWVPRACLDELKALKGKDKLKARALAGFVEKNGKIKVLEDAGRPDALLLRYARLWKGEAFVATSDKNLRKLIKGMGTGVLLLRDKSHVVKG